MKRSTSGLVCLFVFLTIGLFVSEVIAAPMISCNVTNDSAFANSYAIHDNVCNTDTSISLAAHGKGTLQLCSSGALSDGYGSFKAKKSDSNTWNNFDLIRNGETRSLN
jgi:hypothetical protein